MSAEIINVPSPDLDIAPLEIAPDNVALFPLATEKVCVAEPRSILPLNSISLLAVNVFVPLKVEFPDKVILPVFVASPNILLAEIAIASSKVLAVVELEDKAPPFKVIVPVPKDASLPISILPAETKMPPLLSLVPDKDKVPVPVLVKVPESVIEPA